MPTEQEILDQLASNDMKIIRALLQKLADQKDDTLLRQWEDVQEELRKQLQEIRNASSN